MMHSISPYLAPIWSVVELAAQPIYNRKPVGLPVLYGFDLAATNFRSRTCFKLLGACR
jgi:hypothetical protein